MPDTQPLDTRSFPQNSLVMECQLVRIDHGASDLFDRKREGVRGWGRARETERERGGRVCLFVGCFTSQQHASVPQGRICSDKFTCCHTEIEVADQTFHLTQSQYTDTGPTSPSADPITPGAWQGSHWSVNF